jgi:pimeloyl-ACP methyl ester carboxylesterase
LGFGAIAAAVVTAAGIWQGTLERDGAGLEVEVQVTEGAEGLQGRFSSAQLRAIGVPLSAVRAEADSVTWQLVGDRTTMTVDAMVRGDSLTGNFKDGPDSGVIRLRRVAVSRFAAEGRPWLFPVPAPSAPYWAFSRRISGYDPLHWWGQVRVPVLLAYGAADERVPVQPSISRITSVLQPQGMYTLKVFPQADHAFRVKKPSGKFSWPESVAGYPDSIVDWARRIVADR